MPVEMPSRGSELCSDPAPADPRAKASELEKAQESTTNGSAFLMLSRVSAEVAAAGPNSVSRGVPPLGPLPLATCLTARWRPVGPLTWLVGTSLSPGVYPRTPPPLAIFWQFGVFLVFFAEMAILAIFVKNGQKMPLFINPFWQNGQKC